LPGRTCTGANPVVCTAQDQCHDAGSCDTSTGACSPGVMPPDSGGALTVTPAEAATAHANTPVNGAGRA